MTSVKLLSYPNSSYLSSIASILISTSTQTKRNSPSHLYNVFRRLHLLQDHQGYVIAVFAAPPISPQPLLPTDSVTEMIADTTIHR
jgi:hypothetical protein